MPGSARTTSVRPILDGRGTTSWYLVVTLPDGGSRIVALEDGAELVFGRQSDCTVVVEDDALSRRHAAVRRRGDTVIVEDLESRNGTAINGSVITGSRRVAAGDVISLGPVTAIVASSSPPRGRQLATVGEFEERLDIEVERALRYRRPLGLAMIRLDGAGDAVVEHVQHVLRQLRRIDVCAEYGPDELALVLPETDKHGMEVVAARHASGNGVRGQVGCAAFPEDGSSAGALIEVARTRLRGARTAPERRNSTANLMARVSPKAVVVDPLMKQVFQLASRVAASPINVLIAGETGTGKEMVAEAIHRLGPRAQGPFVKINCAALSESLVEAELFGHEAGAFTGAVARRIGFFEQASGGTLFFDEVAELPLAVQVKLLRVLETRKLVRVGATAETPVDVRVVCATNRALDGEVERGRFREDLLYRLTAFVIPVPPLRDRPDEIVPLAAQFAHEIASELGHAFAGFTPEALDTLRGFHWPGNVRELR
ncbi:MAG TPA: sigma 54-interacting transcriptional regulator, partial [Kofleriaceae bacterium]|nr:sigma 54-interacting transcriptional regulator [Kofleriaceae bacterium]